ncbi:MAG: hypothetical protein WCI88_03760 [Chloroflexota bacterium]
MNDYSETIDIAPQPLPEYYTPNAEKKGSKTKIIIIVLVLVFLCCCLVPLVGIGLKWLWDNGDQLFKIGFLVLKNLV